MLLLAAVLGVGWVFFHVLNEWSEGAYGAVDAVIRALLLLALVISAYHLLHSYGLTFGGLPVAAIVGYIYYRKRYQNVRKVLRENIYKYRTMVIREPKNLAARELLAGCLHELGELDQAIYELDLAVKMGAGTPAQVLLEKWTLERKVQVEGIPVCRWCETENQVGDRYCKKCGFELPYESNVTRRFFAGKKSRKLLFTIIVSTCTVAVIAVVLNLGGAVLLPIIFGVIAYWGWQIVNGART